jgi:hypothetical protein
LVKFAVKQDQYAVVSSKLSEMIDSLCRCHAALEMYVAEPPVTKTNAVVFQTVPILNWIYRPLPRQVLLQKSFGLLNGN